MAFQTTLLADFARTAAVALVLASCGGGSNEPLPDQTGAGRAQPGLDMSNIASGLTLIAGYPGGAGTLDGSGTSARFSLPVSIAIDPAGNLHVADQRESDASSLVLRIVSPGGAVTTSSAPVSRYSAFDSGGNRYIAAGNSIVRVTPEGTASTLAGVADSPGFVDGSGTDARLVGIRKLVVDQSGNLYAINNKLTCLSTKPFGCTSEGGAIRKITPAGVVTTLAGYIGEGAAERIDGAGSAARFSDLHGLAIDRAGNLFAGDAGSIRRISPAGEVTTLVAAVPADPASGSLRAISDLAVGNSDELFLLASQKLYEVSRSGAVTQLVEFSNIDIGAAQPFTDTILTGVVIDGAGNFFVASQSGVVYRFTPAGTLGIFAGMPQLTGSVDGKGPLALFRNAESVDRDTDGNLFVLELGYNHIRKVAPDGTVTTLGSASGSGFVDESGAEAKALLAPRAIAVAPDGNVYIGEYTTIRKLTRAGVLTAFAGDGSFGDADGVGVKASFSSIRSMVVDNAGNLYVAEAHSVRKVTPNGVVTTLAGSSTGGSADGTGRSAFFRFPSGIALDKTGNLYIADTDNATIRKLSPDGVVTTVAGASLLRGLVDGTGSAARFNSPKEIATDEAGNVLVIDTGTVRKITPSGAVTTIAGSSQFTGTRLGDLPGNFARLSGITYLGANVFAVTDGSSVLRLAVP